MGKHEYDRFNRRKPNNSRSIESKLFHSLLISTLLVAFFSATERSQRIDSQMLERSGAIVATISREILSSLTRIDIFGETDSRIGECSGTTTRKIQLSGGAMYTTLTVDHCIKNIISGQTSVELSNQDTNIPIHAEPVMCEEYKAAPFEDNIALCSFITLEDHPGIDSIPPQKLNPDYVWQKGDMVTTFGFPGQLNLPSQYPAVIYTDIGTISNNSRSALLSGNTNKVGCGEYELYNGQSGGPQSYDDLIVAVNSSGCIGYPELASNAGVDLPHDYYEFEEQFVQASLNLVNDILTR